MQRILHIVGTFHLAVSLPDVKDWAELMQEALPAFVLHLEPMMPRTENDPPRDADSGGPQTGAIDEQLMVAFSRGSTDSFGELFSRYKQPMFGFFRRRL